MIRIPEKILIQSHSAHKGSLGLPASSLQRVSGITRKQPAKGLWDYPQAAHKGSLGLPASRKVCPKGFSCLGHFSPCLGVICVIGVSSGLSFAIDHAKWNIDFLSTSVLICRRNTLRMPALLLSGVKVLSMYILSQFARHSYFNAKGDSSQSK